MYASITTINMGPNMRSIGEKIADKSYPIWKTLKGFKGVTYFNDDATGEYASLVLFESWEDAVAAFSIVGPRIQQEFGSYIKSAPIRKVYEVYEPKV